jgi:hypothetical protein
MKAIVVIGIVAVTLLIVLVSIINPTPGVKPPPPEPEKPRKPCLNVLESSWDRYSYNIAAENRDAVVGTARNDCTVVLGSAYVEFTIFDITGAQVGTAIDSTENLGPGVTWRFKAQVADQAAAWKFELAKVSAFR